MKCENCNIYEARTRDYRDIDGCTGKVLHCRWCAGLNDISIYRIRTEKLDPVTFYDSIDYNKLPVEELQELREKKYCEIDEQLDEVDDLDKLLEMERALTLREEQASK